VSRGGSVVPDAPLRLFVALELPPEARRWIHGWASARLEHGRRVAAADLHVTLAFLGLRPAEDLPAVADALRSAAVGCPVGPLDVRGWRGTTRVGMLVLGDETGGATLLQRSLCGHLAARGVPPVRPGRWLPHVTVARGDLSRRRPEDVPTGRTLVPSDAAAYLSHLHRNGARYEALVRVPLESMTRGG
jgi:2'-5' RNA ligase